MQEFRETVGIAGFSACSFADLFCIFLHYSAKKYTDVHKNGKENGFLYIRFSFHFDYLAFVSDCGIIILSGVDLHFVPALSSAGGTD